MSDEKHTSSVRSLVKRWRKKPVVVEAVRWDGSLLAVEALNGILGLSITFADNNKVRIPTLEGEMLASVGDYIIKGVNGEFYPCKPDIFDKTYVCADVGGSGE